MTTKKTLTSKNIRLRSPLAQKSFKNHYGYFDPRTAYLVNQSLNKSRQDVSDLANELIHQLAQLLQESIEEVEQMLSSNEAHSDSQANWIKGTPEAEEIVSEVNCHSLLSVAFLDLLERSDAVAVLIETLYVNEMIPAPARNKQMRNLRSLFKQLRKQCDEYYERIRELRGQNPRQPIEVPLPRKHLTADGAYIETSDCVRFVSAKIKLGKEQRKGRFWFLRRLFGLPV